MRKYLVVFVVFAFFIFWQYSGIEKKAAMKKPPIRIGVSVFSGYAYIFIAQEKGIFKRNGIEVEIVLKRDYLASQEDFNNGLVDGVFSVYADAIVASDQSIPLKVVCIRDQSIKSDAIVARPEVASLEDLKGKKIGVEGVNSFSQLFVLSVFKKYDIGEGDVFFANIAAQELLEALEKGEVVAGHTYGPALTQAKEKGYKILVYAEEVPGIITDVLVFNRKVIQDRPEDIKKIVKSLFEALEFQAAHREEAVQIMARAMGDTPQSIAEGIDGLKNFDLKENVIAMNVLSTDPINLFTSGKLIAEFFINRGQIMVSPDLKKIIDPDFVNWLVNEKK